MFDIARLILKAGDRDIPAVKPWSLMTILCLIFGAISLIALIFIVKKNNKNLKFINVLLFCYGLVFLGLEIYHEVNRFIRLGFYDFSSFPFQFCSIPIYFCLIIPFIKNEKIREPFFYYIGIYCFISGLFPLLFGQRQLCRWSNPFDTFRSFLWHILIMQISIIAIVHKPIAYDLKKTYKPLIGSICIFFGLTVIAQLINATLHYTGGVNFPTTDGSLIKDVYNTSLKDPDAAGCFYISPFIVSTMPVYSLIWLKLGWVWNYVLYLISFTLLAVIVYFIHYGIRKIVLIVKSRNSVVQSA